MQLFLMEDFIAVKIKSQFLRVPLIMLFYENVTVMLMSLEVSMTSCTAVLFTSAIMYAINGFFMYFVPFSMMLYSLVRNTICLVEYLTSALEI